MMISKTNVSVFSETPCTYYVSPVGSTKQQAGRFPVRYWSGHGHPVASLCRRAQPAEGKNESRLTRRLMLDSTMFTDPLLSREVSVMGAVILICLPLSDSPQCRRSRAEAPAGVTRRHPRTGVHTYSVHGTHCRAAAAAKTFCRGVQIVSQLSDG